MFKINKNFFPNKKVVSFIILPIFFIFILIIINFYIEKQKTNQEKKKKILQESIKYSVSKKDTDGDGLLDWQERLYFTDINKKDTDGDGISDKDEIKNGTDPTDKFNRIYSNKEKKVKEELYSFKENPNLSTEDKILRDIFLKTAELKKDNLINNKKAIELISNEILNENDIFKIDFKEIKKEDLKIEKKITVENFKKSFYKIIKKYSSAKAENELSLAYKTVILKDTSSKKKVQNILKKTISFKDELLKIKVPSNKKITFSYLKYINSVELYISFLDIILNYNEDPVKFYLSIKTFDNLLENININTKNLIKIINI